MLNIQGKKWITNNDGSYAVVQTAPGRLEIFAKDKSYFYEDEFGKLEAMAVSGVGTLIATFSAQITTSANERRSVSMVRVLDISSTPIKPLHNEVWKEGFGKAVSITPSSDTIAIGSPKENTVYTYRFKRGEVTRQSRSVIKYRQSVSAAFGSKVALSDSGESIVIAAPEYSKDGIVAGKVLVYIWVENGWEPLGVEIYGSKTFQYLGIGGIAIDDINGRVDVRTSDEDRVSFEVCFTTCVYLSVFVII